MTNPVSTHNNVKISAQVLGLGPKFMLKIILQNTGLQPILGTVLSFSYNPDMYVMGYSRTSRQCIPVSILLPGPRHVVETEVRNTDAQGRASTILIVLSSPSQSVASPVVCATVRMPNSELSL